MAVLLLTTLATAQTRAVLLPYTINSYAGTFGVSGNTGNGGPATAAKLNTPQAVAADPLGNIFIADLSNLVIRKVDATTKIISLYAGGGTVCAAKTDSSGDGCPPLQAIFSGDRGVTTDPLGNVYVIDYSKSLVRKINAAGTLITAFAGTGSGGLGADGVLATTSAVKNPIMAAVDGNGVMYLADTGNNRIRKIDANGYITSLSTAVSGPDGITVDPLGTNLYVADTSHYIVVKMDTTTGATTTVAGILGSSGFTGWSGTANTMKLAKPTSVATDFAGNIYIMDISNGVIWFVDVNTGYMRAVAGNGQTVPTTPCTTVIDAGGDGCVATLAVLGKGGSSIDNMGFDPTGNLFIAEYNNQVVRQVSVNTQFPATTVGNNVIQTVDMHFGAGDSPSGSGFSIASGSGFSVQPTGSCTTLGDNTQDCLVQVTFAPAAPGATSAVVSVVSSLGTLYNFTVNGTGLDPAPNAQSQTVSMNINVASAVTLSATDQFNAALTYTVLSNPTHGTLSGTAPSLTYTPTTGYYGVDGFTFKANNGTFDSNVANVTLNVNNTPATAQPQTVSVSEGGNVPVVLAATQASNAAITYTVVDCPVHGTLSGIVSCPAVLAGNTATYTPTDGYYGPDGFTFKANNGAGDSNTALVTVNVTFAVDPNSVSAMPTQLTFAPVSIGMGSSSQVVTFTNKSGSGIVVTPSLTAGFTVRNNNCTSSIAPGFSCNLYIASTPTSVDQTTGTLSLYYGGASPKVITLAATPVSLVDINLTPMSFPATAVGLGSPSQTVNVFNRTGVPVTVAPSIAVSDFIVASNNCPASLPALNGCTIWVRFTPKTAGPLSGVLAVTAGGSTQNVNLSGAGVGLITVSPAALTFPTTVVGQGSSSQAVGVLNSTGSVISLAAATTGDFLISANNCPAQLQINYGCYIYVRYTPTAGGTRTGSLVVTPSVGGAQTVALTGLGQAFITAGPSSLTFSTVSVGQGSSSQTVDIANRTGVPISITPTMAGSNFMVSANNCPAQLAANNGCTIWVRFTPKSAGPVTDTLTLTPSTGSAVTVALLGSSYVVAADGSGDFTAVQAAVNALPAAGGVITIKPGTYTEVVNITKPNVQLRGLGSDPSQVVITYDNANGTLAPGGGTLSTSGSATVTVGGDNFYAENLTMQNTYDMEVDQAQANSQAVAFYVKADRAVLRNMRFIGRQDTVYATSKSCTTSNGPCVAGRQYFYNSYIEGNVDYIFGDGASVFDSCTIHTVRHEDVITHKETGATVTAQSMRYPGQYSGYVFTNSTFDSGPVPAGELGHSSMDVGIDYLTGLPYADRTTSKVYLGRPWPQGLPYSTVVIMNSNINFLINPTGWQSWSGITTVPPQSDLLTSTYAEYNNTMIPGATGPREQYAITLTSGTAAPYATTTFLLGSDNWNPIIIK